MKRLSKSDHKAHRNVKQDMEQQSRENEPIFWGRHSQPIFIPKRKKFKR